ncbi:MAG: PotD/PotF family extracellular solute-binding protein [Lactovum sp.]
MKRLMTMLMSLLIIIFILAGINWKFSAQSGTTTNDQTLVIYNWGDYIDPELLDKFTEETGYKVSYMTFDSNEAMYTKIKQAGTAYDIAVPSEYMIEKMKEENLLIKLDHHKINGLENIDSKFLNLSFDKNNDYSIPYFWGTLGIAYNTKMVDQEIEHWEDLWNPDLKNDIMLIDGVREVIGFGLNTQGASTNSTNKEEINAAYEHLKLLSPNVKAIVADEIKQYMISGEAAVAVTFSGEAAEMVWENEDIKYVVPSEGGNLWFDNLVIPKTSKNPELAYAFINFMLEPENAAQNAEYIGYATPNEKSIPLIDPKITSDTQFYPKEETLENLEVYQNLGSEWLSFYNDKFLEFKMYR